MKKEMKILSCTGIVGYGFPEESFFAGVAQKPDLIACDAGSTDPGPYYLGAGIPFTNATAVKRDMTLMLKAARELDIPLVIGTCGGAGANPHLMREVGILKEIAKENNLSFKLAVITSEFEKEYLVEALHAGKMAKLGPAPEITEEEILASTHIVAQMGVEPIIDALDNGAQVVLTGRCYDPAAFAAPAIRLGYDKALALHLGKILECAAICATPGSGSDCIMGYLGEDYFKVEPLNPIRSCTPLSVSAHTLYEKTNPYLLPGPGGTLDLRGCDFVQDGERACKVTGTKLIPADPYTVKLEGTKLAGYRTIAIAGIQDPQTIARIDWIFAGVQKFVAENTAGRYTAADYTLSLRKYGTPIPGTEAPTVPNCTLGVVLDAVAKTQDIADEIMALARARMLHYDYPGRKSTAGNLAFPYSPSDIHLGAVYTFSIYHLMEVDSLTETSRIVYEEVGQ